MDHRHKIHRNIFTGLTILLVFFIPFNKWILPPLIVLMVLNWLVEGAYITGFSRIFTNRKRLLTLSFTVLYFLYLLGMTYTINRSYGWTDMETKLSLFIFPLILATSDVSGTDRKDIGRILLAFLLGTVTASLIFIGHSAYLYFIGHISNSFYYGNLSWYMHASYLSMYANFALTVLVYLAVIRQQPVALNQKILLAFAGILLYLFIILLSSRAGILTLIIQVICFTGYLILKRKKTLAGLGFLAGCALFMIVSAYLFPFSLGRFTLAEKSLKANENKVMVKHTEASVTRVMIWKAALSIFKEHPIAGVGTGDVKDALVHQYRLEKLNQEYFQRLNAHNQFIQTAVAIGIFGLAALILQLVLPGIFAFRKEQYLYLIFLIVFSFNLAFESMLEVQAGTIFYGFFNSILFWYGINLEKGSRQE